MGASESLVEVEIRENGHDSVAQCYHGAGHKLSKIQIFIKFFKDQPVCTKLQIICI